jgi:hypothetical protein
MRVSKTAAELINTWPALRITFRTSSPSGSLNTIAARAEVSMTIILGRPRSSYFTAWTASGSAGRAWIWLRMASNLDQGSVLLHGRAERCITVHAEGTAMA